MRIENKIKGLIAVVFVFCLGYGVSLAASNQDLYIPSGENIPTDLIQARQNADVGGDVQGDVILAGANASYSGNAAGDVLLAAGNARVTGNVAGNVRVAGGNVILSGTVGKNVTVAGGSVIIEENSVIKGNLYVAGGKVEMRGQVEGNANAYGSQLLLAGKVAGNADLRSNAIVVRSDARIGGNLTYASNADVALDPGVVSGSVARVPLENLVTDMNASKKDVANASIGVLIWQFLSLLVSGIVLFNLFGRQARALMAPIQSSEIWNRIAYGLLYLLLNPIIIFITFISLIGLPLALIILFVYIVLIIAAVTLTPVLVGKLLNGRFKLYSADDRHLVADFIVGYVLMQLVGLVPILGGVVLAFLFLFSFGRITHYAIGIIKANRA